MEGLPTIYVVAHGDTAWSEQGRYVGTTDLPLTKAGETAARGMRRFLSGSNFRLVLTSPLQRALRTCELLGYSSIIEIDSDLSEWNYGDFEGRADAEIHATEPDWQLFRHGCPHGELPGDVAKRADRVIERLRMVESDVLICSSVHFIRALGIRWIGLGLFANAKRFSLSAASISAVGYENDLSHAVIKLWNDTHHAANMSLAKARTS